MYCYGRVVLFLPAANLLLGPFSLWGGQFTIPLGRNYNAMKKNKKTNKNESDTPLSADEMLKKIIKEKKTETEALKKIIDSLEKKLKPKM